MLDKMHVTYEWCRASKSGQDRIWMEWRRWNLHPMGLYLCIYTHTRAPSDNITICLVSIHVRTIGRQQCVPIGNLIGQKEDTLISIARRRNKYLHLELVLHPIKTLRCRWCVWLEMIWVQVSTWVTSFDARWKAWFFFCCWFCCWAVSHQNENLMKMCTYV